MCLMSSHCSEEEIKLQYFELMIIEFIGYIETMSIKGQIIYVRLQYDTNSKTLTLRNKILESESRTVFKYKITSFVNFIIIYEIILK